jgi:hypothetical protein
MSKMVDAFGEVLLEEGGQYKRQTPRRTEARPAMWGLAGEPVLLVRSAAQHNGTMSRWAKLLNVQLMEGEARTWYGKCGIWHNYILLVSQKLFAYAERGPQGGSSPRGRYRQHSTKDLGCTHMSYNCSRCEHVRLTDKR